MLKYPFALSLVLTVAACGDNTPDNFGLDAPAPDAPRSRPMRASAIWSGTRSRWA